VRFIEKENHYSASIQIKGVSKYLGYFKNELDAANSYQEELKKITEHERDTIYK